MSKIIKKVITLSSLIPMSGVLTLSTLSSCGKDTISEVHILEADDIHGEIPGFGDSFFSSSNKYAGAIRTANEMQKIVDEHPGSICLSGGDNNSSGTFSVCTKGETMYPVLSAMDIRYSAVGNHAWDWGKEPLENYKYDYLGRTADTLGNYFITGNVLDGNQYRKYKWCYDEDDPQFELDYEIWKDHKVQWADPAKIVDMRGHNVCLIGLTTTATMSDGNQEELKDTSIIPYIPSIHYIKHFIKEEQPDIYNKIDAFVLYTHIGHGEVEGFVKDLDTNVDLILGAHTHSDVSEEYHSDVLNKDIDFIESQAHLASFSDAKLVFDDSKPVGSRLIDVTTQNIIPQIPENKAEAAAQLNEIIKTAKNKVVMNTISEYAFQKERAIKILNTILGHSNNGLEYEQLGHQFDKPAVYPKKHDGLIEQVGAWLCKSQILGFNTLFANEIAAGEMLPVSISYCTNDAINTIIEPDADVLLKDIYGFYPYENKPVYGVLTYYQLEQIISYTLSGAADKQHKEYTEEIYNTSTGSGAQIDNLRTPYGQSQMFGMSFQVEKIASDNQGRVYKYKNDPEHSLKVFDAVNNTGLDDINDTTKYEDVSYWGQDGTHYIPIVINSFNYNGGNNQQKMIKQFCEFNAQKNHTKPELQVHEFPSTDIRELTKAYLDVIKSNPEITVDMPTTLLQTLFLRIGDQ